MESRLFFKNKFSTLLLGLSFITVIYISVFGTIAFQPKTFNLDFVAFYCAGQVSDAGFDPYRVEPLRTCEHQVGSSFRPGSVLVLPAPLPAYDISVFRIISRIPFNIAQWLWFACSVLVCIGCCVLCFHITRSPPSRIFFAFVLSLGYVSVPLGQILPFSLYGLLLAVYAAQKSKYYLLPLAVVLSAFEPHLALPGILSLLFFSSNVQKMWIIAGGGVLAGLAFCGLPVSMSVEYVHFVLPLHALSEINNQEQFGSAHVLHSLFTSEAQSVRISECLYGLVLVISLCCVYRLRSFVDNLDKNIIVFLPVTLCMMVSPFLHITQVCAAIPLLLTLSCSQNVLVRRCSVVVLGLLAVPWMNFAPMVVVAPIVIVITLYFANSISPRLSFAGGLAGLLGVIGCGSAAFVLGSVPRHMLTLSRSSASSFAEIPWREAVDLADVGHEWLFLLPKLPMIFSCCIILFLVMYLLRNASLTDLRTDFS